MRSQHGKRHFGKLRLVSQVEGVDAPEVQEALVHPNVAALVLRLVPALEQTLLRDRKLRDQPWAHAGAWPDDQASGTGTRPEP